MTIIEQRFAEINQPTLDPSCCPATLEHRMKLTDRRSYLRMPLDGIRDLTEEECLKQIKEAEDIIQQRKPKECADE